MDTQASDATVLFAPETFNLAETTRMIEVSRHLRDRYHCVFAGYNDTYAPLIRAAGFDYQPLEPHLTDAQAQQLLRFDQGRGIRHPFTPAMVRERVKSEIDLIRQQDARVVVIGTTLSQMISARAAGIPLVYVKPFAYSLPQLRTADRLPVTGSTTLPGRLIDATASRVLRAVAERLTIQLRGFRIVAAENRVSLPRRTFEAMDADLNLITSLSAADVQNQLPAHYRWVGPVFAKLDDELPTWVTDIIDKSRRDTDRPLVYFAMGSSANKRLVTRVLHALATMPIMVIAPVAAYFDTPPPNLGPHIHICDVLPAHRLTGQVDASVIHGGEGTVQTAVYGGRPFVGIGLQPEQRSNIDDCVQRGTALSIRPREAGTVHFRQAVHRVLTDPTMRSAARALKDQFGAINGAQAAADHVRRIVEERA